MSIPHWMRSQPRLVVAAGAVAAVWVAGGLAVTVEAHVRARLEPESVVTPTRYYARPIVLYAGATVPRTRVEGYLTRQRYRRARTPRVGIGEYRLESRRWTIGRRAFRQGEHLEPAGVTVVRLGSGGAITSVRDGSGRRVAYATLEPEVLEVRGAAGEDRIPVSLDDVPASLVDAVLSIEDQRFYEHGGFDLRRIVGANLANARAGRVVQGGSTVTQQLAKNLYLSPRRTAIRKLRELAMARTLERRHTKDEILAAYLNQVYLGQDGGRAIHGVGLASRHFFGKDVSRLELHEAALLAGLIRGPSLYSPFRNPDAALGRRNLVLDVMLERGLVTPEEHEAATAAPLGVEEPPAPLRVGRYFVDYVAGHLASRGLGDRGRGLSVFTTLDAELQRAAEAAVAEGLAELERSHPALAAGDAPVQGALVALDPYTGEVLAMVGGRDYGASQFNRAANARRQPGSAFKPVVALAALARARDVTLATRLADEPLEVETPAGTWRPANYDGRFRGDVSLREAIVRSLNVPFARLGMAIGPERVVETARDLGLEGPLPAVPSIALGSSEVTPLELTRAYGVLAAEGFRADLQPVLGVADARGDFLSRIDVRGREVYAPAEAYLVTSALRDVMEDGTGRGLRGLGVSGAVAGKSGTTNGFRDAWFVGYTPTLAVGVWVGFDDGRGLDLPGSRAALPIFARFLREGVGRRVEGAFRMPQGIEIVEVHRGTGLRAGPGCRGEREIFLRGTAPRGSCAPGRYWSAGGRRRGDDVAALIEQLRRRMGRGGN